MAKANDPRKRRLLRLIAIGGEGFANALVMLLAVLLLCLGPMALFLRPGGGKVGSDRAGCILNLRNVQAGMRDYQATNHLKPGDAIDWAEIIGPGKHLEKMPVCPLHGTYYFTDKIPASGALAAQCSLFAAPENHQPTDHADW